MIDPPNICLNAFIFMTWTGFFGLLEAVTASSLAPRLCLALILIEFLPKVTNGPSTSLPVAGQSPNKMTFLTTYVACLVNYPNKICETRRLFAYVKKLKRRFSRSIGSLASGLVMLKKYKAPESLFFRVGEFNFYWALVISADIILLRSFRCNA